MITIESNDGSNIRYKCTCGAVGECIIKPTTGNKIIVLDIICPHCFENERIKLSQYTSDEGKKSLIGDDVDLFWTATLENRLI